MSWIVLIIIILSVSINGQRIITPPKNYTGIIGGSAEFICHVELDVYQTVMSWEFNNDPVYIYQYGAIEYPKAREKYMGNYTKKRDAFTLAVMNLSHSDVGWYKCVVVSIEKSALLLVLDKPQIHIPNNNPVAGSKAQYICKAGFAGPSTENIALAQYPQLRMILDGNLLDGSIEEKTDSSGYHRQLTQVHEVKLEARMNRKIMICDLGTSSPPTHVNVTAEMMVLYPVRSITYTPKKGQCEIGTEIICTADGNPEPYFLWDNIENIGNSIEGPLLNITKQMIGENNWRCTATNALGGRSYQASVLAACKVVGPVDIETSSNDSWIIAVSVIISTFIIIIVGIIVSFCYQMRKSKPTEEKANGDETDDEFIPMINANNSQLKVPGSSLSIITIVCGEDGRKWEKEIRQICYEASRLGDERNNAVKQYSVQTYNSLKNLEAKHKVFKNKTKKFDREELVIIVSSRFINHINKYVDSLKAYPIWLPNATIIVDLPAKEIPDWFEKRSIKFIDTRKYDDISTRKKISEALFGETLVKEGKGYKETSYSLSGETLVKEGKGYKETSYSLSSETLVKEGKGYKETSYSLSGDGKSKSIAEVLAWAYYFNYINIIGPGIVQRIEYFEEKFLKTEQNPVVLLPRKLFILLPSSRCGHPKLDDADSAIKSAGKLRFKHEIAGNTRNYDTAVYKITGQEKTYHACVEHCTPVLAIHETTTKGMSGFSEIEEKAQLHIFYELLKAFLNLRSSRQFCHDFKLVPYNDEKEELSKILVKQIKECLETESNNSDIHYKDQDIIEED